MQVDAFRYHKPRPSFAAWLLAQTGRADPIGLLARAAVGDCRFPKHGDVDEVSRRLNEVGADGDVHQALEDAELDYLAY